MIKRNISPLRNKETFLGTVLLIASALFLIGVAKFPDTASRYRAIAPSFFPNLLGIALAILSGLILLEGIRKSPGQVFQIQASKENVIRAVMLLGALIAFVLLFRLFGFVLMAFVLIAGLQLVLGEKRILRALLIALAVTAALYIIFVVLLRVSFPVGTLFR